MNDKSKNKQIEVTRHNGAKSNLNGAEITSNRSNNNVKALANACVKRKNIEAHYLT